MSVPLEHVIDILSRYIHIVCTTLLVGGTLFYEMVVPSAIADLKEEQQLLVFARARWTFNSIVWSSVIMLLVTGFASSRRHWPEYKREAQPVLDGSTKPAHQSDISAVRKPGWWWVAHFSTGCLALLIAISLTSGRRLPDYPVQWMRLNMVILLVVIFLGSAARHMRLINSDALHGIITRPFSGP